MKLFATNRKVEGSFLDGIIRIFLGLNPSGRTVALGWTQPVTEISTRDIFRGKGGRVRKADKPTTFLCRWSKNFVSLILLEP
jgi:hypothetical protein